jgi:hypothetical protein
MDTLLSINIVLFSASLAISSVYLFLTEPFPEETVNVKAFGISVLLNLLTIWAFPNLYLFLAIYYIMFAFFLITEEVQANGI